MSERITSKRLGEEPLRFGAASGILELYDGLKTPVSEDIIELSGRHQQQIEHYVKAAAANFAPHGSPAEPTFAQTEIGAPSLVVRVDCTVVDGEIIPYEMEDSPSGQGIADKIHRSVGSAGIRGLVLNHYEKTAGGVPHVIVSGARSHGTDDALIVGNDRYLFDADRDARLAKDDLVIVKTIPGDKTSTEGYVHLQERALAPLLTEGDKTYQERLGQLAPIASAEQLLRDADGQLASQALKSRLGSMAMGVSLYLTPAHRQAFGKRGVVTASRLAKDAASFTEKRGGALVQPFAAPIQLDNPEGRSNAILRVFTLLGRENDELTARAIGGCYVARPELIVHGASNAVNGAVVLEGAA